MNKRGLILIGSVLGAALLIVVSVLLFGGNRNGEPEPNPTPSGSVVLPNGQVVDEDEYNESLEDEPEGTRNPDGTLEMTDPHNEEDGHNHEHDHGDLEEGCIDGPVSTGCEGEDWTEMPSHEQIAAGQKVIKAFSSQWVDINTLDETATARAARLKAAGASETVSKQLSAITRPDTALLALQTVSRETGQTYVSFMSNRDGVYTYSVSITIIVDYSLNGNQNQRYTTSGTMRVAVDSKNNTIVSVEENFRDLLGLT